MGSAVKGFSGGVPRWHGNARPSGSCDSRHGGDKADADAGREDLFRSGGCAHRPRRYGAMGPAQLASIRSLPTIRATTIMSCGFLRPQSRGIQTFCWLTIPSEARRSSISSRCQGFTTTSAGRTKWPAWWDVSWWALPATVPGRSHLGMHQTSTGNRSRKWRAAHFRRLPRLCRREWCAFRDAHWSRSLRPPHSDEQHGYTRSRHDRAATSLRPQPAARNSLPRGTAMAARNQERIPALQRLAQGRRAQRCVAPLVPARHGQVGGVPARYRTELDRRPDAWAPILAAARAGDVILLYSSHDTEHNNAVVLRDYLNERLEQR